MVCIETSAPGKVVVLGEYAVLEGASALVSAVSARSRVRVEAHPEPGVWLRAPDIGVEGVRFFCDQGEIQYPEDIAPEVRRKLRLVETVVRHFEEEVQSGATSESGLRIEIDTHEFFSPGDGAKFGVGSSAATAVALVGALKGLCSLSTPASSPELDGLFELSLALHRDVQGGVGSGVDIAAGVYGGWLEFKPSQAGAGAPEVSPLVVPSSLLVVPVFTGHSASTAAFVKRVYEAREGRRGEFDALIAALKEAAEAGVLAFRANDVPGFMGGVSGYFNLLRQLGELAEVSIVSEPHEDAAVVVAGRGGVYKSSGAGGGDIGVALFAEGIEHAEFANELKNKGLRALPLTLGGPGFQMTRG